MKELFKQLDKKVQLDIAHTLSCYPECNLSFYNGEYHASPNLSFVRVRPKDYKFLGTFYNKDFYKDTMWYFNAWYKEVEEHERTGNPIDREKFEQWADEQSEIAITNYLK